MFKLRELPRVQNEKKEYILYTEDNKLGLEVKLTEDDAPEAVLSQLNKKCEILEKAANLGIVKFKTNSCGDVEFNTEKNKFIFKFVGRGDVVSLLNGINWTFDNRCMFSDNNKYIDIECSDIEDEKSLFISGMRNANEKYETASIVNENAAFYTKIRRFEIPYRKLFKYYIKKVMDENGFKWEIERRKWEIEQRKFEKYRTKMQRF